jgi:DNA-binding CsgD family transcriptional regulator
VRPDLAPDALAGLLRRAGGNPLLLTELAVSGEPSASLRLALAARLRQLDVEGRGAFGMLALAGRPVDAPALGPGAASLLTTGLVEVVPDGLAVRHSLLGEVALELLDADLTSTLHARLARVVRDPGEAARHHLLAGERELALTAALEAAEAAPRPGERASHLGLAAGCATGPDADALRLRAAQALDEADDWHGVVAAVEGLVDSDPQTRAWAALLRARGAWAGGDAEGLRTALSEGLALVAGSGTEIEVRLRIEQSRLPIFVDSDVAEGIRMTTEALRLARATGVDEPRAQYLYGTALGVADAPGWAESLLEAMEGARRSGDRHTEFMAANNLISFEESAGSPDRGRALAREMAGRAAELGLGYWERGLLGQVAGLDFHAGDLRSAVAVATDVLAQPIDNRGRDTTTETLCLALVDLGRIDEAVARVTAAVDAASPDYRGRDFLRWVVAEAALWGGRPLRAVEAADRVLADLRGHESDPNLPLIWLTRAWALVDLGRDPGPPPPERDRGMLRAVPHEAAGLQLLHAGRPAQAVEAFDRAADLWAPYHRRGELRCGWAAGEALRRAGDDAGAIARLEGVERRAGELGYAPLAGRVRQSLRAAGRQRSAQRSVTAGGLTGREREVLALVAEGLTNAEVAARLGVARRTVVAQVASASAKLGATSRAQAASLAASSAATSTAPAPAGPR